MPTESAFTGDQIPETILREIAVNLVKETREFQRASRRLLFDLLATAEVHTVDERGAPFPFWLLIVVRGRVFVETHEARHRRPVDTMMSRAALADADELPQLRPGAYWPNTPPLTDQLSVDLRTQENDVAYVLTVDADTFRRAFVASPALAYSYRGPALPGHGAPDTDGSGPPLGPVAPVTPSSRPPTHERAPARQNADPPRARFDTSTTAREIADTAVQQSPTVRRLHPRRQRRRHRRRSRHRLVLG